LTEQSANASEQRKLRKSRYIRINVFFFLVFILFVALVVRLGIVQIVQGEEFSKEVSRTESDYARLPAPRGKMYDRYNRVVVDNESVPAITYTVDKTTKTSDKIKTATKLSEYINFKPEFLKDELKERDLRDYWLATHPDEAEELLSEKELTLKPAETYKLQVDRVPKKEILAIQNSLQEQELAYIYKRFSSGYQYEPQVVKSTNLSENEVSIVAENLESLPGVDVITDWGRKYPYDDSLKPIFGGITTPEQGIPLEREDYFTVRGYPRNERVGKSFLEQQYEDYLNPRKAKVEYISDNSGSIVSEKLVDKGQRGHDLKLSFDIELQMKVEKIIEEELRAAKRSGANFLMDRTFVVMMDPFQGDVLAMAGKQIVDGKMQDYAIGAFSSQYEAGSIIKGATVLAGYQDGMPMGQGYYDTKLYFKGTPPKGSYSNLGYMTDLNALKKSSNVYMFYIALRIADEKYVKNGPLNVTSDDFQKLRNYFAQFGLGVQTGIDLPQESAGLLAPAETAEAGKLLDIAIGQFDTYTPLQMAQYVSVIANGGIRVQPRLVTSIHAPIEEPGLGPVAVDKVPKVLNKINNSTEEIKRVQQGFKLVTSSGTARGKVPSSVAGKTGTSQTQYYGPNRNYWGKMTNNYNFVGYYPADNPEVAFSVVVPWAGTNTGTSTTISRRIIEAYAELQEKYVTTTGIEQNNKAKEGE
jgi:cell division protein FtsI/penicillin-binding protein 2